MWVLFRALFEHRFWPFAFLLRLLKADFRVLRLLNRFWEGLLKKFAFVEPFLKQRGALHHRDSTWPVLDACFYLLDDCWIGPFCVEWMLDEPNFYADFENSRWMSVGWALDTRWMEAFLPAEISPLPIAENLTISQVFLKKLFLCLSRRTYWVVRGESSAHKNCSSGYCLVRLTGREQICTPFVHMTIEATKNDRSDYGLARTVVLVVWFSFVCALTAWLCAAAPQQHCSAN